MARIAKKNNPIFKGKWYKIISPGGHSFSGGSYTWDLPKENTPGNWSPSTTPELCYSGYHLVRAAEIPEWLRRGNDSVIYLAEPRGEYHDSPEKTAFSSVRLLKKIAHVKEDVADIIKEECPPISTEDSLSSRYAFERLTDHTILSTLKAAADIAEKRKPPAQKKYEALYAEVAKILKTAAFRNQVSTIWIRDIDTLEELRESFIWGYVVGKNPAIATKLKQLIAFDPLNGYGDEFAQNIYDLVLHKW